MQHPEVAAIPDNQNCYKDLGAVGIKNSRCAQWCEGSTCNHSWFLWVCAELSGNWKKNTKQTLLTVCYNACSWDGESKCPVPRSIPVITGQNKVQSVCRTLQTRFACVPCFTPCYLFSPVVLGIVCFMFLDFSIPVYSDLLPQSFLSHIDHVGKLHFLYGTTALCPV